MKKNTSGSKQHTVESVSHDSYKARFFYAGVYAMKRRGINITESKSQNK